MNKEKLAEKQAVISEVNSLFKDAKSFMVVEYRGLSVKDTEDLRKQLRKEGSSLYVFKNTLVNRALSELGMNDLNQTFTGPNAYVFSKEDPIAGPRIVVKFAKEHDKLIVKGGVLDGKFVSSKELAVIATLPNKEGLLSMLLSVLNAPVVKFALAVKAIADQKQATA